MKPKNFKEFHVDFPVWGNKVTIIFTNDFDGATKFIAERDNLNLPTAPDPRVFGALTFTGKITCNSIIFLQYNACPEAIAHEAWHVVYSMMKHFGAEIEDEVVAYHLGYLVGEIHKFKSALKSGFKSKSRGSYGRPSTDSELCNGPSTGSS